MTSQPGKQIIAIHTLPNISKSKINQTIKFGQFIEHKKIFLKKKIMHKMWWRNYSQVLFSKTNIELL